MSVRVCVMDVGCLGGWTTLPKMLWNALLNLQMSQRVTVWYATCYHSAHGCLLGVCPAQPANVKASVPVTNNTSLLLPIMPGIHQDYVTHTSDSVGRQKVASGDSFIPESDVECSTWLANVMSDDRQHDVHPVTNTCSSLLPMPLMPGLQQDYLSHAVPAQMLGQSSQQQSHPPIMASTHTPLLQRAFSEPPSRYNR